eukprot:m.170712 g.170712  ORF g.170712 m.170712 type:complete len:919 (-) comp15276_c16_seq1:584-3340(-)
MRGVCWWLALGLLCASLVSSALAQISITGVYTEASAGGESSLFGLVRFDICDAATLDALNNTKNHPPAPKTTSPRPTPENMNITTHKSPSKKPTSSPTTSNENKNLNIRSPPTTTTTISSTTTNRIKNNTSNTTKSSIDKTKNKVSTAQPLRFLQLLDIGVGSCCEYSSPDTTEVFPLRECVPSSLPALLPEQILLVNGRARLHMLVPMTELSGRSFTCVFPSQTRDYYTNIKSNITLNFSFPERSRRAMRGRRCVGDELPVVYAPDNVTCDRPNCLLKYMGSRNYFNNATKLCQPYRVCPTVGFALDLDTNVCFVVPRPTANTTGFIWPTFDPFVTVGSMVSVNITTCECNNGVRIDSTACACRCNAGWTSAPSNSSNFVWCNKPSDKPNVQPAAPESSSSNIFVVAFSIVAGLMLCCVCICCRRSIVDCLKCILPCHKDRDNQDISADPDATKNTKEKDDDDDDDEEEESDEDDDEEEDEEEEEDNDDDDDEDEDKDERKRDAGVSAAARNKTLRKPRQKTQRERAVPVQRVEEEPPLPPMTNATLGRGTRREFSRNRGVLVATGLTTMRVAQQRVQASILPEQHNHRVVHPDDVHIALAAMQAQQMRHATINNNININGNINNNNNNHTLPHPSARGGSSNMGTVRGPAGTVRGGLPGNTLNRNKLNGTTRGTVREFTMHLGGSVSIPTKATPATSTATTTTTIPAAGASGPTGLPPGAPGGLGMEAGMFGAAGWSMATAAGIGAGIAAGLAQLAGLGKAVALDGVAAAAAPAPAAAAAPAVAATATAPTAAPTAATAAAEFLLALSSPSLSWQPRSSCPSPTCSSCPSSTCCICLCSRPGCLSTTAGACSQRAGCAAPGIVPEATRAQGRGSRRGGTRVTAATGHPRQSRQALSPCRSLPSPSHPPALGDGSLQ